MSNARTEAPPDRTLAWLIFGLAAVLFAMQLRSLFVFPEPNSFRWYGDETWLMTEAHQQLSTGKVTYPLAIGSQLAHGKGLVLSMTWLSAVLYGLPIWLSGQDPVATGRIVTAMLALGLLFSLYFTSRTFGVSRLASALVILFLVGTRAFFFASHSARPDLLAGLIVMLVIGSLSRASSAIIPRRNRGWFAVGAALVFLAVSSSVHLITLLGPVAIYLVWQGTKGTPGTKWQFRWACAAGAISLLGILVFLYYLTNGSLRLFPPSASNGQFHDVLHAIPIFRPFSRSVQVANIVIRFKEFVAEAPAIFLLPLLIPFTDPVNASRRTLALSVSIVALSWLFLEGAEINYLMHLLPLLFLCGTLAIAKIIERWHFSRYTFFALAVAYFILGLRDAGMAFTTGSEIHTSNQQAAKIIDDSITSSWRSADTPLVLTEPPMLERLSQDRAFRTMTDHFISFPNYPIPYDSFFSREHVNYAVLYNSPTFPKNRPVDDPFYQSVLRNGDVVTKVDGMSGDAGRNYFDHSNWQDTILLVKLKNTH